MMLAMVVEVTGGGGGASGRESSGGERDRGKEPAVAAIETG
jgi:hypothetical protein